MNIPIKATFSFHGRKSFHNIGMGNMIMAKSDVRFRALVDRRYANALAHFPPSIVTSHVLAIGEQPKILPSIAEILLTTTNITITYTALRKFVPGWMLRYIANSESFTNRVITKYIVMAIQFS